MGGRPPKAVEDASRSVLLELFNEKEERAIVANMIANAKRKGITAAPSATTAATWLWDRKYGKVKERTEISGPDNGPIELADARNELAAILSRTLEGRDASGAPGGDRDTPAVDSGDAAK